MRETVNAIPDTRHPNSPLVEVVFEVRFPGETAIECRRHEIQDRIRCDYPNLFVPVVAPGVAYALEPYRFEKLDQSAGIIVALNRFGYYSRSYPGFERFKEECLRLIEIFSTIVPVAKINRVGLRHINIIPFVRENGLIPLEYFFVLGQKVLEPLPYKFENFNVGFVMPTSGGKVTTRIESITKTDGGQEAFLLDFDFAKAGDLYVSEVNQYLEEAHRESGILFNSIITRNYDDYIRGEGVL
jgi:uncharacterized protein (TIGR04255 family)